MQEETLLYVAVTANGLVADVEWNNGISRLSSDPYFEVGTGDDHNDKLEDEAEHVRAEQADFQQRTAPMLAGFSFVTPLCGCDTLYRSKSSILFSKLAMLV